MGCGNNVGDPSEFVTSHRPSPFFSSESKKHGVNFPLVVSSSSRDGPTADRRFEISITGGTVPSDRLDEVGQRILREYASHVEDELKRSGATINVRQHSGPDKSGERYTSFRFEYIHRKWQGFVVANSAYRHDEAIQIDVLIYEHSRK